MRTLSFAIWAALLIAPAGLAGAAEPPPLDAYGDLPGFEDAAISPKGETIAIVGEVEGARRLLLLDSASKLIRQSELTDLKVRALEWIGEDSVLVTYSETERLGPGFTTNRFESFRTLIVPTEGEVSMIFGKSRTIVGSVFGRYGIRQVGGRWKGYFGGVELERSATGPVLTTTARTLFEVDLVENGIKKIAAPAGRNTWRDWLIDPDGNVAATFDMDRDSGTWTIRNSQGKQIGRGTNAAGSAGLVSLGSTGQTLIYAVEEDENRTTRWYELPLTGDVSPAEVFTDVNIASTFIDRFSGKMIGFVHAGTRRFFDPAIQVTSDRIDRAFSKLDTTLIDWSSDFNRVLVRTSGNGDSGTWYLVDLGTLRAEEIGIERPLIAPEQVGPISSFEYSAADGLKLDGVLTLPPGREAKNLPVVVFPHGGPSSHDEVQFDWWAQAFASRGYAVFQPNFRGSTHRDQAFERAGDGEWGRKMQSDISDGLAALVATGIVDRRRACIMGASYGGYAALAGVTLQQGLYRCAVAVAPVTDLKLMYDTEYRESGTSRVVRTALLQQLGERSRLEEISPRRLADKADAPILLIHGKEDTVVPFRQSQVMADALKDAGKPYALRELHREDHWLSRAETRKQMLGEAMAFVLQHNPPD